MQRPQFTAETSSPVARPESLMWILVVGLFCKYHFAKVDVVGAYLHTPRPPGSSVQAHVALQTNRRRFRQLTSRMEEVPSFGRKDLGRA